MLLLLLPENVPLWLHHSSAEPARQTAAPHAPVAGGGPVDLGPAVALGRAGEGESAQGCQAHPGGGAGGGFLGGDRGGNADGDTKD